MTIKELEDKTQKLKNSLQELKESEAVNDYVKIIENISNDFIRSL